MTFSTATPLGKKPAPAPKAAPLILPPVRVVAFDPWADSIDPERFTAEALAARPDYEIAPLGWFRLSRDTRARLCGVAIALLAEHPPIPANERYSGSSERLNRVRDLFGVALMGAVRPREDLEANGLTREKVALAARFYIEDENERSLWHRDYLDLAALGISIQVDLMKQLLRKLDGNRGVVATLRESRKKLDGALAWLERLVAGGGPA